jgi:hypothetical protein
MKINSALVIALGLSLLSNVFLSVIYKKLSYHDLRMEAEFDRASLYIKQHREMYENLKEQCPDIVVKEH